MGNNGGIESKDDNIKPEKSESIVMTIEMSSEGKMMVHFPMLNDRIATYGFLKMAEKTLDRHYIQAEQEKIILAKAG